MSDKQDKNDLTSIEDFSKSLKEETSGESSSSTAAPYLESQPVEQVEDFEPIESSIAPPPAIDNSSILVAPPEFATSAEPGMTNIAFPNQTLEDIRDFSAQSSSGKSHVPAAFPFSLLLEGQLTKDEKDKLLEILAREKMGISEVDMESQLEGTKILIPRISEYAGVLIAQALRSAQVTLKLAPADLIFSTADTLTTSDERFPSGLAEQRSLKVQTPAEHPAEIMPVTAGSALPELPKYRVIGVITATAALKTTMVETENSSEYQEALDALQKELRYKAHHRHAVAILNFSTQLTTLALPSQYRLTVSGTAIKNEDEELPTSV